MYVIAYTSHLYFKFQSLSLYIYIFILAHVSALRAGGHVPYDRAFGTPTCGLKKVCDKRKKYPQQVLNPGPQG